LSDVARIWRGGCIIRAKVLEDILVAYHEEPDLENMIFAPGLKEILTRNMSKVGKICQSAIEAGIAMPAFMASLAYFNAVRSGWLPANLIQAQRDYFGSHTYERTDRTGTFHTDWSKR
jgi:6-phosphogluconate dehydrogenase